MHCALTGIFGLGKSNWTPTIALITFSNSTTPKRVLIEHQGLPEPSNAQESGAKCKERQNKGIKMQETSSLIWGEVTDQTEEGRQSLAF